MKLPKVFMRKLVIGAVLILAAALLSVLIKEFLDTQDPEHALPMLTVSVDEKFNIPDTAVYRAGYEWSFFTTIERSSPQMAPEDLPIQPYEVFRGNLLKLTFTKEPKSVRVWRADGRFETEYVELALEGKDTFSVPPTTGIYVYRVLADWGSRGYIQYYFAVNVAD